MNKFQDKITILNFLTCTNSHMIEKPLSKSFQQLVIGREILELKS